MRQHSLQLPSFPRLARERLRSTASVSTQELACGSPRERGAGKHPLFPRAWEYLRSDKLRAERETDHNEERSLLCSVCGASCRHSSPSQRGREVRRRSPSVQAALGPVIFNASSMKCFSALAGRKKKNPPTWRIVFGRDTWLQNGAFMAAVGFCSQFIFGSSSQIQVSFFSPSVCSVLLKHSVFTCGVNWGVFVNIEMSEHVTCGWRVAFLFRDVAATGISRAWSCWPITGQWAVPRWMMRLFLRTCATQTGTTRIIHLNLKMVLIGPLSMRETLWVAKIPPPSSPPAFCHFSHCWGNSSASKWYMWTDNLIWKHVYVVSDPAGCKVFALCYTESIKPPIQPTPSLSLGKSGCSLQ